MITHGVGSALRSYVIPVTRRGNTKSQSVPTVNKYAVVDAGVTLKSITVLHYKLLLVIRTIWISASHIVAAKVQASSTRCTEYTHSLDLCISVESLSEEVKGGLHEGLELFLSETHSHLLSIRLPHIERVVAVLKLVKQNERKRRRNVGRLAGSRHV